MVVANLSLTSKKRLPTYVHVKLKLLASDRLCLFTVKVQLMSYCLQGTGLHDLLSLSQLQILPKNICSLANSDPYLTVNNIRFALHLINGVYELPYTILTRGDSRRYRLPRLVLTPGGAFTPVSSATWTKRVISVPQLISFRKLVPVFLHQSVPSFG